MYSIYQHVQAPIEWLAVCRSEYRQLKPLTTARSKTHTHTHTASEIILIVN